LLKEHHQAIYNEAYFLKHHQNWFLNPDISLYASLVEVLKKNGGTAQHIMDVGCGTGNFLKFIGEQGFANLYGLDVVDHDIPGISFINSSIEEYKPDRYFDTIVSLANIEHIADVRSYIHRLSCMIRQGGILIIYTVDCDSFIYRIAKALYKAGLSFPCERLYSSHHLNHFSVVSLNRLVHEAGFVPVDIWKTSIPVNSLDIGNGPQRIALLAAILPIGLLSKILDAEMLQVAIFKRT
jgi:cyclopropane fatty-acyl-phospholipid synthase-like methyltransferase